MNNYEFKYLDLINKSHLSMSNFQIQKFIIEDQLTDYKKIKQCLLELRTRYNQFEDLQEEIKLKEINIDKIKNKIKKLNKKLQNTTDEYDKEYLQLKLKEKNIYLRRAERNLNTLNLKLNYLKNEIQVFEKYLDDNLKKFDKKELEKILQNTNENFEKEKQYWKEKFTRSAVFELISQGRISSNLLESISDLDKNDQAEILFNTFKHFENLKKTLAYIQEDVIKEIAKKEQEMLQNKNESLNELKDKLNELNSKI